MPSHQIRNNRFAGRVGPIAAGILVALVPIAASAQAGQTLVVAFNGASTAVPLSGWLSLAVALVIAASAIFAFRNGGKTRFWAWPITFIAAAALYAAVVSDTAAIIAPSLFINLTTSPGSVVVPGGGAVTVIVEVDNGTGGQITIGSVSLSSGAYSIVGNGCTVGLVLPANGNCLITLQES